MSDPTTRAIVAAQDRFRQRNPAGLHGFVGGTLTVATGVYGWVVPVGVRLSVRSVTIAVLTAPASADLIVDVNKNGVSTFNTTPANRPTITVGTTSATSGQPDTTSLVGGDVVTVDIDQGDGTTLLITLNCVTT